MSRSDYLVVGAGASAMAFVDTMFHETDATFTLIDRRPAAGGHWNDSYPFVQLHQPASCYGVASLPLGSGRIEDSGYNEGLPSLASGPEVVAHFHQALRETMLPSGRVRFIPMAEHLGDGDYVSLLSGESGHVEAATMVDATLLQTSIPLTHRRSFEVAAGVACVPPNDLPRQAPSSTHITVLGAGKTGFDCVLWLLANGAPPERISWVVPRDPWVFNRAGAPSTLELFEASASLLIAQSEAIVAAESLEDMALRCEAAGVWMRLDPDIPASMYHAANVSVVEMEHARRVRNVIRLGRVTAIHPDKLILERGSVPVVPNTLFVDCTASALDGNVGVRAPVFEPGRIALQMIRQYQPTFSAALIGHLEATLGDGDEKQAMAQPVPMSDTVEDYARGRITSTLNEGRWAANPEVASWVAACRLNVTAAWSTIPNDDVAKRALLARLRELGPAVVQRLTELVEVSAPLA